MATEKFRIGLKNNCKNISSENDCLKNINDVCTWRSETKKINPKVYREASCIASSGQASRQISRQEFEKLLPAKDIVLFSSPGKNRRGNRNYRQVGSNNNYFPSSTFHSSPRVTGGINFGQQQQQNRQSSFQQQNEGQQLEEKDGGENLVSFSPSASRSPNVTTSVTSFSPNLPSRVSTRGSVVVPSLEQRRSMFKQWQEANVAQGQHQEQEQEQGQEQETKSSINSQSGRLKEPQVLSSDLFEKFNNFYQETQGDVVKCADPKYDDVRPYYAQIAEDEYLGQGTGSEENNSIDEKFYSDPNKLCQAIKLIEEKERLGSENGGKGTEDFKKIIDQLHIDPDVREWWNKQHFSNSVAGDSNNLGGTISVDDVGDQNEQEFPVRYSPTFKTSVSFPSLSESFPSSPTTSPIVSPRAGSVRFSLSPSSFSTTSSRSTFSSPSSSYSSLFPEEQQGEQEQQQEQEEEQFHQAQPMNVGENNSFDQFIDEMDNDFDQCFADENSVVRPLYARNLSNRLGFEIKDEFYNEPKKLCQAIKLLQDVDRGNIQTDFKESEPEVQQWWSSIFSLPPTLSGKSKSNNSRETVIYHGRESRRFQ